MISSVKQAIANKLLELYPGCKVYDEDISQNLKKPSFLIIIADQDYSKKINTRQTSLISFDLAYFSNAGSTGIKTDCQDVQVNLLRELDLLSTFRIHNKKAQIVDDVLHVTFDIRYSELKNVAFTAMRTQTTNTNF
jgi:hypothetical protein